MGQIILFVVINAVMLGCLGVIYEFLSAKFKKQPVEQISKENADEAKKAKKHKITWKDFLFAVILLVIEIPFYPELWDKTFGGEAYFNEGWEYHQKGDMKNAVEKWKIASEKGNHKAEFNLGLVYQQGRRGIVENYQEAAKWYGLAAEGGVPEGQYNLGIMYLNGQGVPRNTEKGIELLKKAAKKRLNEAKETLNELGIYDYD